jgi:DNA-binding transcriptional LysR family regulator
LTAAGSEFLLRARALLDDAAEAVTVVQRIGTGQSGIFRVGVTPPAAPVLVPHLRTSLAAVAPDVDLVVARLWLPLLEQASALAGVVALFLISGVGG